MKLSTTQRAYIAGFLDGDGSVYVRVKPNDTYRYKFQIVGTIAFFQSAKSADTFTQFHQLLGVGTMRKRKDGILEITVCRTDDINAFVKSVGPYVRAKRKQIELLVKVLDLKRDMRNVQDFEKLMQLVDTYRELNYSKNRKHRITP